MRPTEIWRLIEELTNNERTMVYFFVYISFENVEVHCGSCKSTVQTGTRKLKVPSVFSTDVKSSYVLY
jgi:hypothetical protein